jgi:hypothetical protein
VTIHDKPARSATFLAEILDESQAELFMKSSTRDRSGIGLQTRGPGVRQLGHRSS